MLWHICWRQELLSQQRKPLLGNGSANMPIARQQLHNTQEWNNWEVVFCVLTATWCNNRRTVGRGVFYAVCAEATKVVDCELRVSSAVWSKLDQLRSCNWKVPASQNRSHWTQKKSHYQAEQQKPWQNTNLCDNDLYIVVISCVRVQ
jgi:hypothetical protein